MIQSGYSQDTYSVNEFKKRNKLLSKEIMWFPTKRLSTIGYLRRIYILVIKYIFLRFERTLNTFRI